MALRSDPPFVTTTNCELSVPQRLSLLNQWSSLRSMGPTVTGFQWTIGALTVEGPRTFNVRLKDDDQLVVTEILAS